MRPAFAARFAFDTRAFRPPGVDGAIARRPRKPERRDTRLESLGEVERRPDPEDARAWRVWLTPEGARAADAVDAASAAHFTAVVARLDDAPAILDALRALGRAMTLKSETNR